MGILGGALSRRSILRGAGLGLGGIAGGMLVGCGDDGSKQVDLADESLPLEVTRLRIPKSDGTICGGALYVAHPFLVEEGFTNIEYPELPVTEWTEHVGNGTLDINYDFGAAVAVEIDRGRRLTSLAGMHGGCYELFARDGIDSIGQLRGKRVAVTYGVDAAAPGYAFMAYVLAFVGVPPDHTLASYNSEDVPELLRSGEIDAAITIPPWGDELRDAGAGHVILNSMTDRPWSDYYCCFLFANKRFVQKNPVATKRIVRAVLKGADVVAREPERAARYLVDNGHTADYAQTLRTLKHLHYDFWRTLDSEDSLRFYGLRLRQSGVIKTAPNQLVARGADFRFLNQIKREMAYAPRFPQQRGAFALDCEVEPAAAVAGPRQA